MRYFDGVRNVSLFVVGPSGESSPSPDRLPPRRSITRRTIDEAAMRPRPRPVRRPSARCRIQPREPADLIGESDAYIEGAGCSRR